MPDDGSLAIQQQPSPLPGGWDDAWAARVSRGVQRGDREALAEFYCAWFDRSMALAAKATGRDESFCLDTVQDAMLKAAGKLRRVETIAQLSAWMRRVVLSCAMDRLREEAARERRQNASSRGREESTVDDLATSLRLAWLEKELSACTAEERALLRQRVVNQATLEQAGAMIGASGAVAHGRIRRIIEALRRAGKARFGDA